MGDNLAYAYDSTKPNQLNSVSDAGSRTAGFITPNGTSGSYGYDNNGNLISDPYKGITLKYSTLLNLADTIMGNSTTYLTYTYDAAGNVIRKQHYSSGTLALQIDYIGGFMYTTQSGTTSLTYITNTEGRIVNNSGTLAQEYIMTDQQGNARFSFQDSGGAIAVKQENSYYPFGETYKSSTLSAPTVPNKNLYNGGSEWQNDFTNLPDYQQTPYRNYDAEIGRFVAVDPQPESAEDMNVYQYAGNNPIMGNDPTGGKNSGGSGGNLYGTNQLVTNFGSRGDPFAGLAGSDDMGDWFQMLQLSAAFSAPPWSGGGSNDGNNNASLVDSPISPSGTNIATDIVVPGGTIHIDDGSTAVYKETPGGDLVLVDAGNGINQTTMNNLYSILFNGNYTFVPTNNMLNEVQINDKVSSSKANQGGDISLGLTGASLDAMSKTQSSVGIFTQRMALGDYGNGWEGSQYVNTFKLGKVFDGASTVLSVYTTGKSYYDIANGNGTALTYSDATVGTIGLGAKILSYYNGVEIPFVGEGVAIYGTARTSWDLGNIIRPAIAQYEESSKSEGYNICLLAH